MSNHFEGVETRRRPSKCSDAYDEGIVQGVVKATQTRILWSTVQVCHALPTMEKPLISVSGFFRSDLPPSGVTVIEHKFVLQG